MLGKVTSKWSSKTFITRSKKAILNPRFLASSLGKLGESASKTRESGACCAGCVNAAFTQTKLKSTNVNVGNRKRLKFVEEANLIFIIQFFDRFRLSILICIAWAQHLVFPHGGLPQVVLVVILLVLCLFDGVGVFERVVILLVPLRNRLVGIAIF